MKIILVLFLFFCSSAFGQTPAKDPHWQLLWQDSFTSFDSNKWVKAENCDHNGGPTLFTADNVDNYLGHLRIRLFEEDVNCSGAPPTTYVCGTVNWVFMTTPQDGLILMKRTTWNLDI